MSWLFVVAAAMLHLYRERNGSPAFWAEPRNALSNLAFVVAAGLAYRFARRHGIRDRSTTMLIGLAGVIGVGSFVFHTVPNRVTMWLDIVPIALFQIVFLWLLARRMTSLPAWGAMSTIGSAMVISFGLMPVKAMNGSLFYVPVLFVMGWLAMRWAERAAREPYLLVAAVGCFGLALTARTVDWDVPWEFGSHFIWHMLNGVVLYLAMRAWMVHCLVEAVDRNAVGSAPPSAEVSRQPAD